MRQLAIAIVAVVLASAGTYFLGLKSGRAEVNDARSFDPASATEIFALRSKCAELGQKILESNGGESAGQQNEVSHYNPQINRCYVRLDVSNAILNPPADKVIQHSYLYDGQTGEQLGWYRLDAGKTSGHISMIDWQSVAKAIGMHVPEADPTRSFFPDMDYETAQDFIEGVMLDDRTK